MAGISMGTGTHPRVCPSGEEPGTDPYLMPIGSLRADRQRLSTVLEDEYRSRWPGGNKSAAGKFYYACLRRLSQHVLLVYIPTCMANEATQFLWLPCGIVRGALAAMGINATVQAETSELPQAIFQIKTIPAKA